MGLNIKSDEAISLTRELAALTGETLTGAITVSVSERLERLRHQDSGDSVEARAERVLAIARDMRARIDAPLPDHDTLLYGDDGLPR